MDTVKKKKKIEREEKEEAQSGYSTRERVIGAPQHRSAINGLPVISASFLSPLYIHGCKTLIRSAIKDRNAYITRTGGGVVYIARRAQNTRRRRRRARGGQGSPGHVVFTIKRHNYIRAGII